MGNALISGWMPHLPAPPKPAPVRPGEKPRGALAHLRGQRFARTDMTGEIVGSLRVVGFDHIDKWGRAVWKVEHAPELGGCGRTMPIAGQALRGGRCKCICERTGSARLLEYEGRALSTEDWAREMRATRGIKLSGCTIRDRLRKGWPVDKAITTPADHRRESSDA